VPWRICFARSRLRKRGENLQSEVRRVSWCERGRQAGHEVTFSKGKSADEIQKQISTSPKHAGVTNLTAAQVKDLAAYLATLK
jgi:hypothetical protein